MWMVLKEPVVELCSRPPGRKGERASAAEDAALASAAAITANI